MSKAGTLPIVQLLWPSGLFFFFFNVLLWTTLHDAQELGLHSGVLKSDP